MAIDQPAPRRRNRGLLRVLYVIVVILSVAYVALAYLRLSVATPLENVAVSCVFGIGIVEVMARIVYYYMANNVHTAEAKTLYDMTRIFGYAILLLLVLGIIFGYQYLNSLLVSAGFLGIVVGLAAQSTISNFIAGIYLLASKAIEPGDNVVLHTWQYTQQPQTYPHDKFVPGFSGNIESIGVLYTKMVNEEGVPVYVPNNIVAQALVINYRKVKEHMYKIQFDVDISVSYKELEAIAERVMKRNRIEYYTMKLEYLHLNLYVVTIRLKAAESTKDIKSQLFSEIITALLYKKAPLPSAKPYERSAKRNH